jgi:hypothetical protein
VDRAGADDDEQPIVLIVQDAVDRGTRRIDDLVGALADREFTQQMQRRRKLLDLADPDVVELM